MKFRYIKRFIFLIFLLISSHNLLAQRNVIPAIEEEYEVYINNEETDKEKASEALLICKELVDSAMINCRARDEYMLNLAKAEIYFDIYKWNQKSNDPYNFQNKFSSYDLVVESAAAFKRALSLTESKDDHELHYLRILDLADKYKFYGEIAVGDGYTPREQLDKAEINFFTSNLYFNAIDSVDLELIRLTGKNYFMLEKADSAVKYFNISTNYQSEPVSASHYYYQMAFNLDTLGVFKNAFKKIYWTEKKDLFYSMTEFYNGNESTINLSALDYSALCTIAANYMNMKRYELALKTYRICLSVNDSLANTHYLLSNFYFDQANELKINMPDKKKGQTLSKLSSKRAALLKSALKEIQKSVEIEPKNIVYWKWHISIFYAMNDQTNVDRIQKKVNSLELE